MPLGGAPPVTRPKVAKAASLFSTAVALALAVASWWRGFQDCPLNRPWECLLNKKLNGKIILTWKICCENDD